MSPIFRLLFGCNSSEAKKISINSIEARYREVIVREDAPEWATRRLVTPENVFEMFYDLRLETKEHFITLHLDGKNRIICFDKVSVGCLNQTIAHPREVFKTALLSNAAGLVAIHNHPSGDPNPSYEDKNLTTRLCEAGELLGIKMLDHIIIGEHYFSFSHEGLLTV